MSPKNYTRKTKQMSEKTTTNHTSIQVLETDGLHLTGVIVAVINREVFWEGQSYNQLKATITNGKNTFTLAIDDKKKPLPDLQYGQRVKVEVEYAKSEKGMITVRGLLTPT